MRLSSARSVAVTLDTTTDGSVNTIRPSFTTCVSARVPPVRIPLDASVHARESRERDRVAEHRVGDGHVDLAVNADGNLRLPVHVRRPRLRG